MKESTKKAWTFGLAIFGAALSTLNAAWSMFQFWDTQKQSRINTAIELSRNYHRDRDVAMTSLALAINQGLKQPSLDELRKLAVHADLLEYVSFLALNDRAERSYLSMALVCDVAWTGDALEKNRDRFATRPAKSLIVRFGREVPCQTEYVSQPRSN